MAAERPEGREKTSAHDIMSSWPSRVEQIEDLDVVKRVEVESVAAG